MEDHDFNDYGEEEKPRDLGDANREDVRKVYAALQALHDNLIAKKRMWDGFLANEHVQGIIQEFRNKTRVLNLALKDCKKADFDTEAATVNARIAIAKEFEEPVTDSDIDASEKKLQEFYRTNELFLQEFDKPPKRGVKKSK